MKSKIIAVFLTVIMLFTAIPFTALAGTTYYYETNKKQTAAAISYISDIYLANDAVFGLLNDCGSRADNRLLSDVAKNITKNCKTKKEAALAISSWVKNNIVYDSGYSNCCYPIDVYCEGRAVCAGFAMLMSRLMRYAGIPAVMMDGMRGDMKTTVTKNNLQTLLKTNSHGWVMAYFDGEWHLFDPLFNTVDVTDTNQIAANYFCNSVEGISPYYDGMDMYVTNNGKGLFYKNGKIVLYNNGKIEETVIGYSQFLNSIDYNTKILTKSTAQNMYYVGNHEKTGTMSPGQALTDGFLTYSSINCLFYAQPNGILAAATTVSYNGKTYVADGSGTLFEIPNAGRRQFYGGKITLLVGETVKLGLTWTEGEISNGRTVNWTCKTPKTASVDNNGNITVLSPGYITIEITSKNPETNTLYVTETLTLYAANSVRGDKNGEYYGENAPYDLLDVDDDGKVTAADARLILRAAVELEKLNSAQTKAADADNDGEITPSDARTALRVAVGLQAV